MTKNPKQDDTITNMKLINFYFRHKKLCLIILSTLIVGTAFYFPNTAFAQELDSDTTKLLKDINEIFNLILRLSAAWLWPVIMMIGSLLDNDLIFGGAMGERLLGVWVQIRNLVNIVFVLILLAIAVYNVLPISEEGGGLPLGFKTVLPKFILALIAVNFSFIAVKVVLDFTNVITGAVFALPTTAIDNPTYNLSANAESIICGTPSKEVPMKPLWCDQNKFNARAQAFFSKLDRNNITLAYAIRFGKAPQLKFIRDGLADLSQLGFNIIFNTVLYFVFACSFIALFLVLLFRLVVLWVAVVLSPVIALTIVLPNLKELAGGGGELQDQFVKNAIAPIKIGLVLSIGYIMLDGFEADKTIHGDTLSSSTLSSIDPNSLPTDITDLQQLMIAVATVVIIWVGVFKAADETAAKGLTGFIRDNMQGFGKWVAKLPMYAQVIPTGGKVPGKKAGEGVSPMELMKTFQEIPLAVDQARGRSLLGLLQRASNEDAKEIMHAANNAKNDKGVSYARLVADKPHVLATIEGWEGLKKTLIDSGKVKDEPEFKRNFGDRYGQDPGAVKKIYDAFKTDHEFQRQFKDENELRSAIEAKQIEKIDSKSDALEILDLDGKGKGKTALDLSKMAAFAGVLDDKEIEQLRKLPREIIGAVVDVHNGKVDDIPVRAIAAFVPKLTAARTEAEAKAAVSYAKGQKMNDDVVKKIIDAVNFSSTVSGDALRVAARSVYEAQGAGTPQPPPVGNTGASAGGF